MNNIKQAISIALQSMKKNKMRSLMTVFGIMIGIAMVVIVLSAGNGIKGLILEEISSFGDDWINVEIKIPSTQKNSTENSSAIARGVQITTLTEQDQKAIEGLDNIKNTYAGVTTQVVISHDGEKKRPTVFGVSNGYADIAKVTLSEGRFYTEEDKNAQVVVLGSEVKKSLFGENKAVGEVVKIEGKNYRVSGVMEPIGSTGFVNRDEIIYIPLRTTQKRIMGIDHVLWLIAQTKDNSKAEATAEEMRWLIRDRHGITDIDKDDFAVTTLAEAISIVNVIITGITWLLIGLAAISLLVGGVGIMNVMYVSVAERTFEIGLRKSVGATKQNIMQQFLTEATVMTLLGGIIGVCVGGFISLMISLIATQLGYVWTFKISILSIILSTTFSALVGIGFGLYPARKAASLDPIVAIRQE